MLQSNVTRRNPTAHPHSPSPTLKKKDACFDSLSCCLPPATFRQFPYHPHFSAGDAIRLTTLKTFPPLVIARFGNNLTHCFNPNFYLAGSDVIIPRQSPDPLKPFPRSRGRLRLYNDLMRHQTFPRLAMLRPDNGPTGGTTQIFPLLAILRFGDGPTGASQTPG